MDLIVRLPGPFRAGWHGPADDELPAGPLGPFIGRDGHVIWDSGARRTRDGSNTGKSAELPHAFGDLMVVGSLDVVVLVPLQT